MKLTKIYFDAYKSLLNKEIELKDQCVGLVGINESGKSNILRAINVLGGHEKLTSAQAPKMGKKGENNPRLRYRFELSTEEKKFIKEEIKQWLKKNTLLRFNIGVPDFDITYHVEYDMDNKKEFRYFYIDNFILGDKYLYLRPEYDGDQFKIMTGNHFVPIMSALALQDKHITDNERRASIEATIRSKKRKIDELEQGLVLSSDIIIQEDEEENVSSEEAIIADSPANKKTLERIASLKGEIEAGKQKIFEFDFHSIKNELSQVLENAENELEKASQSLEEIDDSLTDYEGELDEEEKAEKNELLKQKKLFEKKTQGLPSLIKDTKYDLDQLMTPLVRKYSKDPDFFLKKLTAHLEDKLNGFLPEVVFWQYDEDHILQSETMFADILNAQSIGDISRPLFNIFRIGLEVQSLDDLKTKIEEVQENANERSKIGEKLNKKVNGYIKKVWEEYDQDLRITLEKERIRVEIFDPDFNDHNFYYMEVRSQGAKTFLSFLLTIGVEAKQSVISNTVLLLDEPETHLHPSGVRFLLQELIKISQRDNQVVYATHSIFMIDKDNYGRHVIVKKESEETSFKYAQIDRVGYFMQEEVLYKALDLEFSDGKMNKKYNFVFEGDADTKLFKKFYSLLKNTATFPNNDTSFYYGGGCNGIQKYLKQRPLQLGSVWIFVLDADKPADALSKFINSVYKNYIDQDIFVFQYAKGKGKKSGPIELEDILPPDVIVSCFEKAVEKCNLEIEDPNLNNILLKKKTYTLMFEFFVDYYLDNDKSLITEFKGCLKDSLSEILGAKIGTIKNLDTFNENFNLYYEWATGVIEELNNKIK